MCGQEATIFHSSIQMSSGMKRLKWAMYSIKLTLYIKKNLDGKQTNKQKTLHSTTHNS